MVNYPIVLLSAVIAPFSILIVITFVSHGALFGTAIEGGLIMTFFSAGISLQSDLSHLKNDFKLQDMIVSSPTSPALYMTGMTLAEIVYSIPSLAILLVLAGIYLQHSLLQIAILSLALLLMFAISVALGFMLSTFSNDVVQSYAFSRLLSLLFTTVPPVYYPITYVPALYRYIAYLSPTTYVAEIIQSATGYLTIPVSLVILDWVVLSVVCAVILFIAYKKTRWKDV
ncbi:MAG: ABC transporter permease [Candidatus Bathyarchaeia archaeon]|jgi:ABC-2 type transport system permease protein